MVDITTRYLGHTLQSPIIATASSLTATVTGVQSLVSAGIGAVMVHAQFSDEQAAGNTLPLSEAFLAYVRRLKETTAVPIIASLSGSDTTSWPLYGEQIADAGADAIELSLYTTVSDPTLSGRDLEDKCLTTVKQMKTAVSIPILVKLHPYFSALANMAVTLEQAGADSLVMFNRFYQPDIDVEDMTVTADLNLSRAEELRLRLRWAAILRQHLTKDLAITGGVHTAEDVIKCIMVGAKAVMMTSALIEYGADYVTAVNQRIGSVLDAMGFLSLAEVDGIMTQDKVRDPAAYERANYMRVLKSY